MVMLDSVLHEILQDQNPWWRSGEARRALSYPVRRQRQREMVKRVWRLQDRRAALVLGPRQVGKTVLLLQTCDDLLDQGWPAANLLYFDFSDERLGGDVEPRRLAEMLPTGLDPSHPRALLLDEVSRAPRWDLWLKRTVDAASGARIVATDSAAAVLRQGGQESGQGRWDEVRLEGLSLEEFGALNSPAGETAAAVRRRSVGLVERFLAFGGFPEHASASDLHEVRRRLRGDIADRAIRRDLGRGGVDVERIARLFAYLVEASGDAFSARKRAGDLEADPRSVREWLDLLLQTQLLVSLDKHHDRAAAGLRSPPRIYAADHGMISAFAPAPESESLRGPLFEAAVFRHLRDLAAERHASLAYFRSHDGLELDFVLGTAGELVGIEVTGSARVRPEKIAGVLRAGDRLGASRLCLIHGGAASPEEAQVRLLTLPAFLLDPASVLAEAAGGARADE
jgi:predicted AAA+ superfamily ATPase